jgi:hypothetical protein
MGFGLIGGLATRIIGFGRKIGRSFGYELAVVVSDHSIKLKMVNPDNTEQRAWDDNLYRHGNVFMSGYANPIKPKVEQHSGLENKDRARLHDTVTVPDGGEEQAERVHTQLMSSGRYQDYMLQDLISQVLNPQEQWKKLFYAVIGTAVIASLSLIASASAAGII